MRAAPTSAPTPAFRCLFLQSELCCPQDTMTSSSSTLPAASMNRQAPAQAGNARRCRRHRWPLRPARGDACSALCQQARCPASSPGTPSQWHGWCGVIGSRRMRRLPSPSVHWNAGTQGSCLFVSTFHVSAKELAIQTVLAPMQLGPQRRQQAVMSWSSRLMRLWHLCWNWAGADSSARQTIEALQHPGAGAGTGSKRCRWRRHFHETCTLTPTAQERGERMGMQELPAHMQTPHCARRRHCSPAHDLPSCRRPPVLHQPPCPSHLCNYAQTHACQVGLHYQSVTITPLVGRVS